MLVDGGAARWEKMLVCLWLVLFSICVFRTSLQYENKIWLVRYRFPVNLSTILVG